MAITPAAKQLDGSIYGFLSICGTCEGLQTRGFYKLKWDSTPDMVIETSVEHGDLAEDPQAPDLPECGCFIPMPSLCILEDDGQIRWPTDEETGEFHRMVCDQAARNAPASGDL